MDMKPFCRVLVLLGAGIIEALAAQPQTPGPDVGVALLRTGDDSRPWVAAGQTLTLGVGVNNLNGDGDAHAVILKVRLPPGLTLQSADPAPNTVEGANLVWNLGTLAAHAFPQTVDLSLEVAPNVAAELAVSATATPSETEAHPEHASDTLPLTVKPAAAELDVQSTLGTIALTVERPTTFALSVINQGTVTAAGTLLHMVLPPKVSFKAADPPGTAAATGDSVAWQVGDIPPGVSRTVAVTIAADPSLAATALDPGPGRMLAFKFDAATASHQVDAGHAELEIRKAIVRPGSDLKVWLGVQGADNPGELPVGRDVTYSLTYGNFGNTPAQHVSVSLNLAEGLTFLRADPSPQSTGKNAQFTGGVLSWDAGELAVGQSDIIKSVIHVASIPEEGSLVMATISASGGSSVNSGENVAYSWRRSPKTTSHAGSAAPANAASPGGVPRQGAMPARGQGWRWALLLPVLLLALWMVFRAR
jgi:uncharacterized repeat protein (TIGR01451 family)